jgi:hypothetical protein
VKKAARKELRENRSMQVFNGKHEEGEKGYAEERQRRP